MTAQQARQETGTIFNIQHYCIHDGPGIRTGVFLKGCPLRCLWCANPESQKSVPQLLYRRESCVGCGACSFACPHNAIEKDCDGNIRTDRKLCTGCGKCVSVCPSDAREIMGNVVTAGEVFDEVAGDTLFYGDDGGVTLTGGEVLSQSKFATAILTLCREAGIHTAIETSGFAPWDVLKPIVSLCDLVLYDQKQMNSAKHLQYTGVPNERILDNLRHINDELDCEIWVRVPTIPSYNNDPDNIRAVAEFVKNNLTHCTQVHLLPYHNLGESKFEQLEKSPNGFSSHIPSNEDMEKLRDIVRSYGILCK